MSAPSGGALYGADPRLLSPFAARLLERGLLKWAIALAGSLGAILEVIDTVITNVALPDIRGNLGATLAEAGWVSTSYACANVIIIPLSAWLGLRFGKKNYFVFSLIGFTLASLLCGVSANLGMLIFARAVQGLAGGGLLAKAQAIIFESFPISERPMAQSIFGLGVIAGPAIGPLLGGWLTDNLGWRWIFFINLPVGILAAFMCLLLLPADEKAKEPKPGSVDWAGIGYLAIGLAAFQIMLEEGQQHDWFSSRFISSMAVASVIAIALFIQRELSIEHPAVDLRVLRYPSMIGGSIYSAILGMGIYGIIFAVPVFVQDYLHYTALQSGELLVPGAIASALAMVFYGRVANRLPPPVLIVFGALLMTCTGLSLMSLNPNTGVTQLYWPLILRGLGGVLIFMPLSIATLGPLAKKDIASGSGFYSLTRQLGSSIGVALITTMLARRQAVHRAVLVEHVTAYRQPVAERLQMLQASLVRHSGDAPAAHERALSLIDRIINGQATLGAYEDLFFYTAVLFIVSLPIILLLRHRPNLAGREAAAAAH